MSVFSLSLQVNQSEISFEIREEDVGANSLKRRSDEGLVSLKEKTLRLEPEPMAAVFFDVEPEEEEEEMATGLKVANGIFNSLLMQKVFPSSTSDPTFLTQIPKYHTNHDSKLHFDCIFIRMPEGEN